PDCSALLCGAFDRTNSLPKKIPSPGGVAQSAGVGLSFTTHNPPRARRRLPLPRGDSSGFSNPHHTVPPAACAALTPPLLQSLESPLSTGEVLIVPLDVSRLSQPTSKFFSVDLFGSSVSSFSGFEGPFLCQSLLLKRLTAPEKQAYAVLKLAVPDNRVPIQEPDRMGVPYLVLRLW